MVPGGAAGSDLIGRKEVFYGEFVGGELDRPGGNRWIDWLSCHMRSESMAS